MALAVNLSLCLPRDDLSVPVVRHVCSYALDQVGVEEMCRNDILLALTEACTNVLDHADNGEVYAVYIGIDEERCTIRVKDTGEGFDASAQAPAEVTAESGRGLELIKALVDKINFTSRPDDGMIVHLEKELVFDESHPVRQRLHRAG